MLISIDRNKITFNETEVNIEVLNKLEKEKIDGEEFAAIFND